jgi:hypothetical protein
MNGRSIAVMSGFLLLATASLAPAQTIGTLRWQMLPYCNVVVLNVVQYGNIFTLDGTDDQCGAAKAASAIGTAFFNPDATIGLGVNIVLAPGASTVHVSAQIALSGNGTWTDSFGTGGTFVLTLGPGVGPPRPTLQLARSGQTMSGQLTVRYPAATGFTLAGASYPRPLPPGTPQPTLEFIPEGAPPTATCPGIGQATAGRLCVYGYNTQNIGSVVNSGGANLANRGFGFSLDIFPAVAASPGYFLANWAYRVP